MKNIESVLSNERDDLMDYSESITKNYHLSEDAVSQAVLQTLKVISKKTKYEDVANLLRYNTKVQSLAVRKDETNKLYRFKSPEAIHIAKLHTTKNYIPPRYNITYDEIENEIVSMKSDYAIPLFKHIIQDMNVREVARELNMKYSTCYKRISKGKKILQTKILTLVNIPATYVNRD